MTCPQNAAAMRKRLTQVRWEFAWDFEDGLATRRASRTLRNLGFKSLKIFRRST